MARIYIKKGRDRCSKSSIRNLCQRKEEDQKLGGECNDLWGENELRWAGVSKEVGEDQLL